MKQILILAALSLALVKASPLSSENSTGLEIRAAQFFNTDVCLTPNNVLGLCYKLATCIRQGGTPSGVCGSRGQYSCCDFGGNPQGTTARPGNEVTVIRNPEYPNFHVSGGTYQYTITKTSSALCNVRIQSLRLSLAPVDAGTTTCHYDYLVISNGVAITDQRCGDKVFDELVPFNGNSPIVVTVALSRDVYYNRIWNIEATPVPC